MDKSIYEQSLEYASRVGRLLGVVGFHLKYCPELDDKTFTSLAKVYLETNTNEQDIASVMEQAEKRGIDLT
jgi:hypothetical protein